MFSKSQKGGGLEIWETKILKFYEDTREQLLNFIPLHTPTYLKNWKNIRFKYKYNVNSYKIVNSQYDEFMELLKYERK